jgi:hypothetical protein
MKERNIVQQTFDQFGRAHGLEKKSGSLYARTEEVIAVSNLQKSQYGPRYYFNQGFWLRRFGQELYPKHYNCHVQLRLEGLLPDHEAQIKELFDLGRDMGDEQRMLAIRSLLDLHLLPLIERGGSIAGLCSMQADGTLRRAGITGPGQQALGIVGGLVH